MRDRTRRNHAIRVPEVRCIDQDGNQIGVIATREALKRSQEAGMDLVEISPMAKPPVCRIMDYGKFKYDKEKRQRESKKNQVAGKLKEIKFHANVGEHDYDFKLRHARDFLEEGHRVKFSLFFRGRENAHREIGFEVMNKLAQDLTDIGIVEQAPRMMGRTLTMQINPSPKARSASRKRQENDDSETGPAE